MATPTNFDIGNLLFGSAIPEQQKIAKEYGAFDAQARIADLDARVLAIEVNVLRLCDAITELGRLHRDLVQTLWLASVKKEQQEIN